MANNIAVSITADVADLQVKRAILSTELKAATKDLNDFAQKAKTSGTTDELRTGMLAAGDAVAKLKSQLAANGAELKQVTTATGGTASSSKAFIAALKEEAATAGMTRQQLLAYKAAKAGVADEAQPYIDALGKQNKAHLSSRATLEPLILVHEALAGNWKRFAGSAMIEAQAVAGAEKSAAAFKAVMTPTGAVVGTVAAVMIAGAIAAEQFDAAQAKLTATAIGTGAASGLTAKQLEAAGAAAADWGGRTVSAATDGAEAFAAAGVRSETTVGLLSGSVQVYAALTGKTAADAQKSLAEAMQDPVRGAQQLHEELGILDGDQLKQIATMTAAGDKMGAVNVITQAYIQRINEAKQAGVGANTTFGDMKVQLSELWTWFGKAASAAEDAAAKFNLLGSVAFKGSWNRGSVTGAADAAQRRAAQRTRDNAASAAGATIAGDTPEQQDARTWEGLAGKVTQLKAAVAAEQNLQRLNPHEDHSAAIQRDTAALGEYKRALETLLPPAEKAHRLAVLEAELAKAKHGHDQAKVADLTRQRSVLEQAGEVKSQADVDRQAGDAANLAEDRTHAAKGKKGPDQVSEWQEQLRAQQVASTDYFRDATADELKFWQGKLALTAKGSHDWIEVQGHIYEASKTLARQDYQEHVAALDEKIEADHADWGKQQADWTEKLTYIKSKYGEQSTEYKHQLAEMERARREHDKQELADTERAIREQLGVLKGRFDAAERIRGVDAQGAEAGIKDRNEGRPLGEIHAATETGALHAQLNQQKLADLDEYHAAEAAKLDAAIAEAATKYHGDESQYRQLLDAKSKADEEYSNRKAELDAQARQQSIQDINAVKQAYHGYVDGLVGSTVSGLDGVISKQKTWAQAGIGIYQSVVHSAEQQIEKMAAKWIVEHVLMTSAQRAQLAAQTAQKTSSETVSTATTLASAKAQGAVYAGLAGAAGVASYAAAPWPLDMGAPAFGASMAAAAASLASFAVGTNLVPNDMVAQIHAGERIIPRADNAKLLAAVDRGTGGGGEAGRGDTHLHYSPTINGQMSFADQLAAHEGHLFSMIKQAHRNGVFR